MPDSMEAAEPGLRLDVEGLPDSDVDAMLQRLMVDQAGLEPMRDGVSSKGVVNLSTVK
jgi:hypothetical protein